MRPFAEVRLKTGLPMTGLILVPQSTALGQVIDDLVLIVEATSAEEEWDNCFPTALRANNDRTRINDQSSGGKKARAMSGSHVPGNHRDRGGENSRGRD
jgi:hypothetical protein